MGEIVKASERGSLLRHGSFWGWERERGSPPETRRRAYAPSGTDRDWSYARRRLGGKVLGRVSMDGWMDGWMGTGEEERIVGPVQFCDVATLAIIHKEN